jgi:hypothetical protein
LIDEREVERVFAEAMAAATRDPLNTGALGDQHPQYAHIRGLFLSLDPNPTAPGALAFAHERALTLLGGSSRAVPAPPPVSIRLPMPHQLTCPRYQPEGRGSVSLSGSTQQPPFGSLIPRPGDAENPICLD